jgi:hypothetical protein
LSDARGMQNRCVPFEGLRDVQGELRLVTETVLTLVELRGSSEC